MSTTRQQPRSSEAEIHVLGGLLLDGSVYDEIADSLRPDDFFEERHQVIYEVIAGLLASGKAADSLSVFERCKQMGRLDDIGGAEYLAEIEEAVPSAAFVAPHARIVRELSALRRMIRTCAEVIERAHGDVEDVSSFLEDCERRVFEVRQQAEGVLRNEPKPIDPLVRKAIADINARSLHPTEVRGLATGFGTFDRLTSGLEPGQLMILAARPSMGKTALALNMAVNAALNRDKPAAVAVFSLEMSADQLVTRMLAAEARVNSQMLRKGTCGERDVAALIRAMNILAPTRMFIDDTPALSPLGLRGKCRRLKAKGALDLVVVDYLQLMHGAGARTGRESREREIAEISRSMKGLAMELQVPVIALSQLNREVEKRKGKKPQLSDLRESGSIEQDADIICFIHREEREGEKAPVSDTEAATLIVAKQRNGPLDDLDLLYWKTFTRFDVRDTEHEDVYPVGGARRDGGRGGRPGQARGGEGGFV